MAKMGREIMKKAQNRKKIADLTFFGFDFLQNHFKYLLLSVFLVLGGITSVAQDSEGRSQAERIVQRLIEDFTENNDGAEEFDFNNLYEDLIYAFQKKIDLNNATAEDLSLLIFLTADEIEAMINYRSSHGDFMSIYELQAVPGLPVEKIQVMRDFLEVRSKESASSSAYKVKELKDGRSQIYLKWRYDLEEQNGFREENGAPPNFAGDRNYAYIRYQHTSSRVRYGGIIEKDAGENFTNSFSETGLDYLSLHYQVKDVTPWLSQLNLGDFSISYGQGLVANNSFALGKSSFTTSINRGANRIRSYNSVSENQAFRGAALQITPSGSIVSGNVFASYTPRDVNLISSDSLQITEFSSLQSSGLHRTESELFDQDGTYEFTTGGSVTVKPLDKLKISGQVINYRYDRSFTRSSSPSQVFRWTGQQLTNASIDYSAQVAGWNLFGEVARSSTGGWAHIHGAVRSIDPRLDLAISYRDYSPEYQSIFSNSFGESANTNNERGIYFGLEFRANRNWTLRAYYDQWRHPWLRFRVDAPSTGREYLARIDFNVKRKRNYYIQYRYEQKDRNTSLVTPIDFPIPQETHRLRLHFGHQLSRGIQLRTRLEGSLFLHDGETERGFLIYQDFISRPIESPLSLSARIAYFNVTDFDARIFTYENDLLFEFFTPAWNGEGIRYYLHARYRLSNSVMAEARWEQTRLDRDTVGSGNTETIGSVRSRIKAQIRWTF